MKKIHFTLLLTLIFIVISCQKDYVEQSETPTDPNNGTNEPIDKNSSLYPHLTFPPGLVSNCRRDHCSPLQHFINQATSKLERECNRTENCQKKASLVDQLLYIEWQKDALGLTNVTVISALCNGFLDETNTYVDVIPNVLYLDIGDISTLEAEIIVGESTCEGDIVWYSDDQEVATVDPLTGEVTAVGEGHAGIFAVVDGLNNILGSCQVYVGIQDYDIAFVVETGYGTWWIVGFHEYYPGIRQLSNEIYYKLNDYFFPNYRFGLVSFEHYPIPPWGGGFGLCDQGYDFSPIIEMSAYNKLQSFTTNPASIQTSLRTMPIMCSYHEWPANWQSAPYSALIKTIQNMNWRENVNKIIVLIGCFPACVVPPNAPGCGGQEGYSGYRVSDVINIANQNDVKIYTINGLYGQSSGEATAGVQDYTTIATFTGGEIYTGGFARLLDAIDDILFRIKNPNQPEP